MPTGIITLPDGRKANISAPDKQTLIRKAKEATAKISATSDNTSAAGAFGHAGLNTFVNTMLNVPEAAGNVLGQLGGAIRTGDFSQFKAPPGEPQILPSANDIAATGQMLGQTAGAVSTGNFSDINNFQQAQQDQMAQEAQRRAEHPVASTLGDIVGTGASLAGLRIPIAEKLGARAPAAITSAAEKTGIQTLPKLINDKFIHSSAMKALGKAAGRGLEGGLEGTVITTLQGGDPKEVAATTAGIQAGGSLILSAFNPTHLAGLGRLAATAGGLTVLFRLGMEFGPGKNNSFDAIDSAFHKIRFGLVTGALAGMAGAGRFTPRNASKVVSIIQDSLTSIPRGMVIGLLKKTQDQKDKGIDHIQPVIKKLASDPTYFGKENGKKIDAAINSGDPDRVSKTIDRLLKNNRIFKNQFMNLD